MRRTSFLFMIVWLCVLPATTAADEPKPKPAPPDDRIVLRSGVVFHGHVLGRIKIRGRTLLRIDTDFGEIRVEEKQVRRRPRGTPPPGVFFFNRIRIAQVRGTVERKSAGAGTWSRVRLRDEYGPVLNAPDAIVKPGDTVRTGAGGFIDLMPHRNVWLRITAGSEVEFPAELGAASIVVKSGLTLQRITGKPRGRTFVIGTPTRLITITGTEFLVEVGKQEKVAVTQGEVEVKGGGQVGAGKAGVWEKAEGAVSKGDIDSDDVDALKVEDIRLPEEDMVYVPGGKYRMGGLGENDAPKRNITLSGFVIDRREVTAEEYARFVKATGGSAPSYFVQGKPPQGQERHPVHNLTADGARSYARWAGKLLPTEAQWEAAARGPKALAFPWGNTKPKAADALPSVVWGGMGKAEDFKLLPVDDDTIDLSPFGLKGMVSSVPEWCRDWYDARYYTSGKDKDPQGPAGGIWRVVRGLKSSPTNRRRTAEDDDQAGAGLRSVLEPD